jgi:hypothetical protein
MFVRAALNCAALFTFNKGWIIMGKITEVVKVSQGRYKLNDAVVIYNLDFNDLGVTFSLDWDENMLSEQEATDLCEAFIHEAIEKRL